jgi:Tfp pilus assembly protein PilN
MIKINLMPVAEEQKVKAEPKGLGFQIPKAIPRGFGAAIVVLTAAYVLSNLRANSISGNVTTNEQILSDLKQSSAEAEIIKGQLPKLRERAAVFESRLENRKVWSELLQEIVLCCPAEIRLEEIKLGVAKSPGVSISDRGKELLIKGFYATQGNPESREMKFRDRLQRNELISAHYRGFIAMTTPQPGITYFTIRCTEQ